MSTGGMKAVCASALAIGAAVAVPSAAGADEFTCDRGEVCLFEHVDTGGGMYTTSGGLSDYSGKRYPFDNLGKHNYLNDSVSYVSNNGINQGPTTAQGYLNANYGGGTLWTVRLGRETSLSGVNNDNTSSHRWIY